MNKEISAPLFEDMLTTNNESIRHFGNGNPYSPKIAFIGQEAAIEKSDDKVSNQYKDEIKDNRMQWENIFDKTQPSITPSEGYSPLFPYKHINGGMGQYHKKNVEINKKGKDNNEPKEYNNGTSPTWCRYQDLYNLILKDESCRIKGAYIDFFEHSFLSDLSTETSKRHKSRNLQSNKNVLDRIPMFKHDFWKSIPVIIIAAGHMPKEVKFDIETIFDVTFQGNALEDVPKAGWCNVHYGNNRPCILFHTHQVTAPYSKQKLFDAIQGAIKSYREKGNMLDLSITE